MRRDDLARSYGVYRSAETEPLLVGRAVAREEAPSRNAHEVDGEDLRRADAGAGSCTGIAMRVLHFERSEGCAATIACQPACADKRRQNCHGGRRGYVVAGIFAAMAFALVIYGPEGRETAIIIFSVSFILPRPKKLAIARHCIIE